MCRNIKKLRRPDAIPPDMELRDAALQFIRKVTGYREPSRKNEAAFNQAVEEVTDVCRSLFEQLQKAV